MLDRRANPCSMYVVALLDIAILGYMPNNIFDEKRVLISLMRKRLDSLYLHSYSLYLIVIFFSS